MKKFQIVILFFCVVIFCLMFFLVNKNEKEVESLIKVEIKGAVLNPGVYNLKDGSRVNDLVAISGGLIDSADISSTNLSKILSDEMVVIIYNKTEIEEMKKGSVSAKFIENECVCPRIENSGCFDEIISNSESIINKTGKVSLNTGTLEELLSIPGIGEVKAQAIIEYRKEFGFKVIEDIMNIKGIGNATFEKIKGYLTL